MKKIWTKEELTTAVNLHQSGLCFEDIAKQLNRTNKAVKVCLSKMGLKQNKKNFREDIICLNCGHSFTSLKVEHRKFCSKSCSVTYNNIKREKKVKKERINKRHRDRYHQTKNNQCLFCGSPVKDKYCGAKCRKNYEQNFVFQKIENGEQIQIGAETTTHRWYKKYLIHKYGEKCMKCGWGEQNSVSGKIPIELEHKDGNSNNNTLTNLELLCPNCHSLTPTYKSLNKGNGRHKRMIRYKNGQSY